MGKGKSTAQKKVAEAAKTAQTVPAAKQKTSSPKSKPGSFSVSAIPTSQGEEGSVVDQGNAGAENYLDDASQRDAESSSEDNSFQGNVESDHNYDDASLGHRQPMGHHRHGRGEESDNDESQGDQSSDFEEKEESSPGGKAAENRISKRKFYDLQRELQQAKAQLVALQASRLGQPTTANTVAVSQVSYEEITLLTSQTVRAFGDKVNQLALNQTPLQRHTRNQCLAPVAEMIDAYVRSDFEADEDWRLWSNDRLIDFLKDCSSSVVDDALNFLTNVHTELFAHTKFLLHCDDDMYWRPDQVMRWLAAVDNSGLNHLPIIGNAQKNTNEQSKGVWHTIECKEIRTSGWYQPLMLNHAALAKMRVASAAYGLTDTCDAFQVTHDVGVGPYAWLFELYHIKIPAISLNMEHYGLRAASGTQLALHFIKHVPTDHCIDGANWGKYKYNQTMALGCGDIGLPVPPHDPVKQLAGMYDIWEFYKANGKNVLLGVDRQEDWKRQDIVLGSKSDPITGEESEYIRYVLRGDPKGTFTPGKVYQTIDWGDYTYQQGDRIETRVLPVLELLRNYKQTKHGQIHDITKKWVKFTVEDCDPPGSIKH